MDKKSRALKVFENESFRLLYTSLMKSMIRQSRALVAKEKNESMMEKVKRRKEGRKEGRKEEHTVRESASSYPVRSTQSV